MRGWIHKWGKESLMHRTKRSKCISWVLGGSPGCRDGCVPGTESSPGLMYPLASHCRNIQEAARRTGDDATFKSVQMPRDRLLSSRIHPPPVEDYPLAHNTERAQIWTHGCTVWDLAAQPEVTSSDIRCALQKSSASSEERGWRQHQRKHPLRTANMDK